MHVSQLRVMLESLEKVYSAAGAKGPAADLMALAEALRAADNIEFDQYLELLRARLQPKRTITEHIAALKVCGLDDKKFGVAYSALVSDGSLKNPELDEIVHHIRLRGMIAGLISNGYYFTPERIKRLNKAGLEYLQISIDNVDPDEVSRKSLRVRRG